MVKIYPSLEDLNHLVTHDIPSLCVTLGWFLNPKFLIFLAALISLSCSTPQDLQTQILNPLKT